MELLVADTQRILKQPGTEEYWACVEVSKIFKLNESMGFASCGTPSDEARLKLQTEVGPNTKEEVTKLAVQIYSGLLSNIKQIDLNLIIFGHESGSGFIRQLKWDDTLGSFEIKDYSANQIVTDGFEEDRFYQIAKARLKDSISPSNNIELDLWAQFVMRYCRLDKQLFIRLWSKSSWFSIDLMILNQIVHLHIKESTIQLRI